VSDALHEIRSSVEHPSNAAGASVSRQFFKPRKEVTMSKLGWIAMLTVLAASTSAMAQTAFPDLRGTWKGESETIISGAGNAHHDANPTAEPRLNSVAFTLVIDKQDGRRISGTFSSARSSEKVIAVVSRSGAIYMVDEDGHDFGTLLAPNRMELCYLQQSPVSRIASCTELTKQP
jgi:hypothetical protein